LRQRNPYGSTHELKQNPDPTPVIQPLQLSDKLSEWARHYLDGLPLPQLIMKIDIAFGVGAIDEALHHAMRHWLGLTALHQQTLDPQRAVDAAPPIS
jgi:hypothetical protein